jgi:hypothetical protein
MYQTPIYKAEREAGLSDKIRSLSSIAYAHVLELGPEFEGLSKSKLEAMSDGLFKARAFVEGHMNLKFLKTLLVSTGWNKNDDVFDRAEVWAARATPEDQPFNLEHDCSRIIGHITDNYVINEAGEKLAEDVAIDELPDKFHIVTGSVLYKHYDKKELKEEMQQIFAEIDEGKWYVSMEALFRGFDYATIDPDGQHHIIARNDDSAFLTKHLRAYGGDGVYEGWKLGRVMRNITFSGKGLVKKPANPESVILATAGAFKPVGQVIATRAGEKNIFQIPNKPVYLSLSDTGSKEESITMANENTVVNQHEDEVRTLKAELATLKAEKDKVVSEKLTSLEAQLKAKADETAAIVAKSAETEKALSETKQKLDEVTAQLATVQAENLKTKRVAAIAKALEVDDEKATSLHDNLYAGLANDKFEATLKIQAADYEAVKKAAFEAAQKTAHTKNDAVTAPKTTAATPKDGGDKKKAGKTVVLNPRARTSVPTPPASVVKVAASEDDAAAVNATETALEDAEIETDVALATESEAADAEIESTRAEICEFLTPTSGGRGRRGRQTKNEE